MTLSLESITGTFDMLWLIVCTALVFLMHAGFTMLEAGLTRAKNTGNIIMKNMVNLTNGLLTYWAIGWALMYGKSLLGGLLGGNGFFLHYSPTELAEYGGTAVLYRDWIFQAMFAATAATIVSGAMAERTKFGAYMLYSVLITAVIYPISGHWIWGGGWLAQLGFHDFAGSTAVHSIGGWVALVGALLVGARHGKYVSTSAGKQVKAIPGHNMALAALGTLLLWFGWYGFNAGSTLSGVDGAIGHIAITTTLAAAGGSVAALVLSWIWFGKPDPSMSMNGALAGLVSITASCWVVNPLSAVLIGIIGGLIVVAGVELLDKKLHIDDPVGAISVHGICGAWGTIAVGLFASGANGSNIVGLFYGGGLQQLGIQLLGVVAAFLWASITALLLFGILRATRQLRVSRKEELLGLDITEHGVEAYPGFQIFTTM